MAAYKVIGACVTAEVDTPDGRQIRYFYRDAILPSGISKEALKHLEAVELIEKVVEGASADELAAAGDAQREAAEQAAKDAADAEAKAKADAAAAAAAEADARIAAAAKGK